MDLRQSDWELHESHAFNFEQFCDNSSLSPGFLSDCELHVYPSEEQPPDLPSLRIRAHRVILSSFSRFFENVFTSGMNEERSGEVKVFCNPPESFRSIVSWIYGSSLDYSDSELPVLYQLSDFYEIPLLKSHFLISLQELANTPESLFSLLDLCYDNQCNTALDALIPVVARFLKTAIEEENEVTFVSELSNHYDVPTFAKTLLDGNLVGIGNAVKVRIIDAFTEAGPEYEVTLDETEMLLKTLDRTMPLKQILAGNSTRRWLSGEMMNKRFKGSE
jgi:hypothetical protein